MPEGPETRRMADSISTALINKKIISFSFFHEQLDPLKALSNISVFDALSKGKAIIIRINGGLSIITHNQLYGKWTFNRPDTQMKTNRKLRIEFVTEKKAVRLWSATNIVLCNTKDEHLHSYINKIGPDVLDDATDQTVIRKRLIEKKFRNRILSSTLLDQSFIAGIGNYLRSEILFFSRLNHLKKPSDLDEAQLNNLSKEIKNVSLRAYLQKGKTMDYDSIGKLFGNTDNFKRLRHMVFGRAGQPCFICGDTVIKLFSSSRRVYLCTTCQEFSV